LYHEGEYNESAETTLYHEGEYNESAETIVVSFDKRTSSSFRKNCGDRYIYKTLL